MKTTRNAAQTREKILRAGTREFALKGLDRARMERVAERAHVTKTLIYHYFGNKDGLFQAVIESAYQALRAAQQDLMLRELEPTEGLEKLVRSTYHAFLDSPHIIPLARSENMHRARHLKQSKIIRELFSPLPATINDLLVRGANAGVFRRGIDPIELYVSIVSLCSYHISNQYSLSVVLETDLMTKQRRDRREQHIVDLVQGFVGVRTPGESTGTAAKRRPG